MQARLATSPCTCHEFPGENPLRGDAGLPGDAAGRDEVAVAQLERGRGRRGRRRRPNVRQQVITAWKKVLNGHIS